MASFKDLGAWPCCIAWRADISTIYPSTHPHTTFTTTAAATAKFFSFAGPVFFALFGKTVCYTSLGVAAQFTGAIPLAGTLAPPQRGVRDESVQQTQRFKI